MEATSHRLIGICPSAVANVLIKDRERPLLVLKKEEMGPFS
jgi:hypothetical protein